MGILEYNKGWGDSEKNSIIFAMDRINVGNGKCWVAKKITNVTNNVHFDSFERCDININDEGIFILAQDLLEQICLRISSSIYVSNVILIFHVR